FGGALAILLGLGWVFLVSGAMACGILALVIVYAMSQVDGRTPILMLVLAGVVTSAFFTALVSVLTYVADPYSRLPAIVFWLMGSLATATYPKVLPAAIPVLFGGGLILLLRWRLNILSLGEEEAAALGVRVQPLRWLLLVAVAAIVAGAVAVSGVVGWVGLIVPHLARMWVGPDHRVLLPVTLLLGAAYLTIIDTLARSLTPAEIPLGILTALVGAPVFFMLLRRTRGRGWVDA
ncbi:MAG: iron ABC transporter permease, partial [Chloroflexales bacterium]|nr:iron ABC transporter permease [Chloroflexales bacterium]